jgi:hypothetical protein
MSTTPKRTPVDPCRAERNVADRAQKAVDLTESKLEADPPTPEKHRLEKLLAQQRRTLATARTKLSACERAHPPKKSSRKAAPKKAAPKKKKKKA